VPSYVPESGADIIIDFMSMTTDVLSPDIFRLWSGISLVAGALERRVWLQNNQGPVFPNFYILLVAPPGVGKQVVDRVKDLWRDAKEPGSKVPAFNVAPDSMTKASLIDSIAKAKKMILPPGGGAPQHHHALLVPAEEFSVLLPTYDMEYVGALNALWNNKASHHEVRRTGQKQDVNIDFPYLNLLGGAQPRWLASIFPEDVWHTGLGRRMIMIYSSTTPWKDVWASTTDVSPLRELILKRLGLLSKAYGQMSIERRAAEALTDWDRSGRQPVPTHAKLIDYNTNRNFQLIKLAIVSAASRGELFTNNSAPAVRLEDVDRAKAWLFEAEALMPDVFRAMLGKSDKDVVDELHMWAQTQYAKAKPPVALDGALIRQFLLDRVPHDKVESILNLADKANIVVRVSGSADSWIPKPRYDRRLL
jgi:hypothetical protein